MEWKSASLWLRQRWEVAEGLGIGYEIIKDFFFFRAIILFSIWKEAYPVSIHYTDGSKRLLLYFETSPLEDIAVLVLIILKMNTGPIRKSIETTAHGHPK
jgi:hypothetical protein